MELSSPLWQSVSLDFSVFTFDFSASEPLPPLKTTSHLGTPFSGEWTRVCRIFDAGV